MSASEKTIQDLADKEYEYGFVTEIEADTIPRGLSEEIVRKSRSFLARRHPVPRQSHGQCGHVFRLEAEHRAIDVLEAFREQARASEEYEGHDELHYRE